jgi:2-polyprenyl-3-methyl-5-hydroxy-6-metoxy-1,4-benzoquinol methylase
MIYNKISRQRKQAILTLVDRRNSLILDIGCGSGFLGEFLKKETGAIVYGVDISHKDVKLAKERVDKAFVFDIEDMNQEWPDEIKEKRYNYIIISEVLEHLLYPEILLDRIKGLINKDSEIIITVPNILFWKNRLKIFFGKFEYSYEGLMDRGHIHFFSWKSLKKTVKDGGYKIIKESHHIPTRVFKKIGKKLPGLFAYQFIIKIKKR